MALAQRVALGYLRAKLNLLAVLSTRRAASAAITIFSTPYRKVKKKAPPIFEKAESLQFILQGKKVYGYRWNHPSSHRFLILHGFESSAFNFDRYVRPMIRKGYTVVAMDAPAHGRSEGKTINLLEYIDTIRETWNRYGPFDAVLAHSFGGLAISLYLDQHPPTKPPQVAMIAPATETTTAVESMFRLLQLSDEVKAEFCRQVEQRTGRPPKDYSITRVAHRLNADILWAHDEDDTMTPLKDTLAIQQQQLPHIRFMVTRGLGHRRIYRDNQVSREILEFFRTHSLEVDTD
jgi:alpha-beta hydrolase superfamily lysophospholipase